MAGGLQNYAELPFQGGGSQSASMKYLAIVAKVVGDATGDEQLLQIVAALANEQPAPSGVPGTPAVASSGPVGI